MQSQRALPPGPALCGGRVDLGICTYNMCTWVYLQMYNIDLCIYVQSLQPGLYLRTNVQTLRHDDRRPPRHAPRIRRNCLKPLIMHSAAMLSATEHVCWEMFPRHGFHHRDMTCDPACVAEAHNYSNWAWESAYTRQVEDMIKVCMNLNSICMSNAGTECEYCTNIMSLDTQDFAIDIMAYHSSIAFLLKMSKLLR